MPTPVRQYTDEIHEALSYWATWLPGASIEVGDCGPVRDRVFKPEESLADYGIEFAVKAPGQPIDLQHASQGAVSYTLQLSGGNHTIPQIPPGKAGIELSFSREHAVAIVVRNAHEHRIERIGTLRRQLLDAVTRGDFPPEYAVVTHVVVAGSATVLISSAANAKFCASAEVDLKAGLLDLANAGLNLTRVAADKLQTEIVADEGLTPLFKLVGFKKNGLFWGSPRVEDLGYEDDSTPEDLGEIRPGDTDPAE